MTWINAGIPIGCALAIMWSVDVAAAKIVEQLKIVVHEMQFANRDKRQADDDEDYDNMRWGRVKRDAA